MLIPLLAYFTYFPKVRLYDFHAVCVSVYPPLLTFKRLNQSL
jgi:hypothetical protein